MLLKEYKQEFMITLKPTYDLVEIDSFFYIICDFLYKKKRIDLALDPSFSIDESSLINWQSIVKELIYQKPIQYILGETEFFGLRFFVNEHTLIPRPETEELVALILEKVKGKSAKSLKILDIGTGSGCIAISLAKKLPEANVFAIDISDEALKIARKNAFENNVEVTFLLQNILETIDLEQEFDIIVSNPPYVRALEKVEIKKNVLDFEPHLALFVEDNDALLFYRKIAQLAKQYLIKNGLLFFEINQYLGKETKELISSLGFENVVLHQDVYGNDRMISGSRF